MLLLALDAATRTGFAIGEVGKRPRVGAVRLKKPNEVVQIAWANMGFFLRDLLVLEKPDLIAIEAPMPPGAQGSGDAVVLQWGVFAVATFLAAAYEIRLEAVNAQTVSKHFTGKARWSKAEGGRNAKKAAAVERAQVLGYITRDVNDSDIADACAVYDFAASKWGKHRPSELVLFNEAPRP
jgi:hypothetical protein